MKQKVLFITPPFTQLNTPYPATAYLKGFLNTKGYSSFQVDLGIEVILDLFSSITLAKIFDHIASLDITLTDNSHRIFLLQRDYIQTIDPVILFLQNKNPTLAHSICDRSYLPEASRFDQLEDLDWAFGTMGIHDKARHLATLYLEDLGDLIKELVDPHFGFSRYAERLAMSASSFDAIQEALKVPETLVTNSLTKLLAQKVAQENPDIVCISVPFPGNLFGALKCGQYLKKYHPHIKIILGGGYANTELRSLSDERVFDYIDYVCLDDGEAPLLILLEYLAGQRKEQELKRVFGKTNGLVCYYNNSTELDIPQRETGTPDYTDLLLHQYLSVIEIVNPMHRLWSDGRWNKLTLAHGCYWGKCSFCDVSLDYIQRYEPMSAALLCDRIEEVIAQTGQNGFHFVDEAAPPALMKELAIEILRRQLTVTWWTNIRFEKSFTADLCRLLKASGCIAISGGLEVASDRLLERMKKGVTVAQVARVADNFTQAGIMVHAYLMYGFPTQTAEETINSLEMVRQLFMVGVVQSGFWHRFAMTAHSPVGINPAAYEVMRIGPEFDGFAENDLVHEDPKGCDHDLFAEGLRKSLFNYMHGVCFDFELADWFDFETPSTTIPSDYIELALSENSQKPIRKNAIAIWLGNPAQLSILEEDGEAYALLQFFDKQKEWSIELPVDMGKWLEEQLHALIINTNAPLSYTQLKNNYLAAGFEDDFEDSELLLALREYGLLIL